MAGLWVRSVFTVWKRSTTPSYRILSSTMLRVMNTPVRPTPALMDAHVIRISSHYQRHTHTHPKQNNIIKMEMNRSNNQSRKYNNNLSALTSTVVNKYVHAFRTLKSAGGIEKRLLFKQIAKTTAFITPFHLSDVS